MRSVPPISLALLLFVSPTPAQTLKTFVLPKGSETTRDKNYDHFLSPYSSLLPVHLQYIYGAGDVPVPAAVIKELTWRRNNYYGNPVPTTTQTMVVTLSTSPNATASMSPNFAKNFGTLTKQVFSGTVNWPSAPYKKAPAPFTHKIPLTTSFTFIRPQGKALLIDIKVTKSSTSRTYILDAVAPDTGSRTNNGNPPFTCKFSNGKFSNSLSYSLAGLTNNGGPWFVRYGGLLSGSVGIVTISAFGIGIPGYPIKLPIDLKGVGMPGCFWNVGLESGIWIPIKVDTFGFARLPSLTIPKGLGGKSFFDQGLVLDKKANTAGWITTWSSKWTIGTLKGPDANTLYRIRDTSSSPTGFFRKGWGTIVRIGY